MQSLRVDVYYVYAVCPTLIGAWEQYSGPEAKYHL